MLSHIRRTERHPGTEGATLGCRAKLVDARFAESLRLADVASAVRVESARLARAFRWAHGDPLASYVRRLRVNAAELLVTQGNTTIAAIADEVGFADQSHLTRSFLRAIGTTPARYREAHRVR